MGKRLSNEEFIRRSKEVHGEKYDYSKVNYINSETKVCIICREHGEFWQRPDQHLSGQGCIKCYRINRGASQRLSTEEFIKKSKGIHGEKYDYSKVEYKNAHKKVCIICPIHGEFWQVPNNHLNGNGCPFCKGGIQSNVLEFIEKAIIVHGGKYDYSKVEYKNSSTKVCIICKEHGEFWQTPNKHLSGQGCPYCNESHLERDIAQALDRNKIEYVRQKRFEWLGNQSLDFYLLEYSIGIECQGEQHYKNVVFFDKRYSLEERQELDRRKLEKCRNHAIEVLYYGEKNYSDDIITDISILLENIGES